MLISIIQKFNNFLLRLKEQSRSSLVGGVAISSSLPLYYRINDLMWQDGLLIDFLQKKVADKWIRRFLVCSSYLFSERVMFKFVVRFYIDFVVWPFTTASIFEVSNVASLLTLTITALLLLITLFNLNYLYIILL